MKKIIVFGGSFNPLHKAHVAIIEQCRNLSGFDEIWIMPSAQRTDKPDLLDDSLRLKMLNEFVRTYWPGDSRVKVTDFEIALGAPSETIKTYEALQLQFSSCQFTFVFGTDSVADMPNWRQGYYLAKHLDVIAVERAGYGPKCDPTTATCAYIKEDIAGISSTLIRRRIQQDVDIRGLVPNEIAQFIAKHHLYKVSAV